MFVYSCVSFFESKGNALKIELEEVDVEPVVAGRGCGGVKV